MHTLIFIVAILCPVLLGPCVLPLARRWLARKNFRRLGGKDGALPDGMSIEQTMPSARVASHVRCEEKIVTRFTDGKCGGRIHQVRETIEHSVGDVFYCWSIARVCLLCGALVKTGFASRILGAAFARVNDAVSLADAIREVKSREIEDVAA